ncbi:MAG: pitrilysin family protein [Candidatus Velthaea sp.]
MFSLLRTVARAVVLLGLGCALTAQSPHASLNAHGDILKATLRNGLRVVIVRNALGPVVSTDMTYLVGSRDDPADVPGMAHAQEHMMFRGTKNLSTSELGTVATALGGNFNALTSDTLTQYQFTIPSADLDAVLRIESDRMRDVLDAQEQWQNERGAIEQEVARDESQPGADFFRVLRSITNAGTPYGHEGVGTRAAFDRLTGPRIKAFHDTWYAPNNAVLVIAGDVDPARTLEQVRARFESIPKRAVPVHAAAHFVPLKRTVVERPTTLVYPLALVAVRMPGIESPDFLPSFVLQGILGSQRGSLRGLVDSGEALDGSWDSFPYVPETQLGFATAALRPGADPAKAATRLENILSGYSRNGVPRELFESTKRRLIADQELSRNSISSLASDWSTTIALDREPSIAREQTLIAAVTLADVNRVAKRYLDMKHAVIGALTPSAGASQRGAASPAQQGTENPLGSQPPVTHLPPWADSLVKNISVPPPGRAPVETKLANGMTLIVKSETISDSVFLFGNVKSNAVLQEPVGKEGVSAVLAEMFKDGTQAQDRIAFARAQDDADTQVSAGTSFGVQTTSRSFERAVALLAQNELQPRFDARTFENARRRAIEELGTALNSTATLANQRAAAILFPAGDPERREPTLSTIQALAFDDVKTYYAQTLRPDQTTVVVVGNVSADAVRAAFERNFGAWHTTGAPPDLELSALPVNPPGDVRLQLPISQSIVQLKQIVPLARTSPQTYPLLLGTAILGGGSLGPEQSRLFRSLRQNAGLVYSVEARYLPRRIRSTFNVEYACAPQNQARIATLIDNEIERMKSEPVGTFELALAKASIVRQSVLGESSTGSIGGMLLDEAISGMPFDQRRIDAQRFIESDAKSIQAAFATYVKPQNFVRIIEGP